MSKYIVNAAGQEVEVPPPFELLSDDLIRQMSGLPDDTVIYEK